MIRFWCFGGYSDSLSQHLLLFFLYIYIYEFIFIISLKQLLKNSTIKMLVVPRCLETCIDTFTGTSSVMISPGMTSM